MHEMGGEEACEGVMGFGRAKDGGGHVALVRLRRHTDCTYMQARGCGVMRAVPGAAAQASLP